MTTRRPQAIRQPRIDRRMSQPIVLGEAPVDWLRAAVWGALGLWCVLVLAGGLFLLYLGLSALWRAIA